MSSARALIQRALKTIPEPRQNRKINLALSGGIDSSVSALLLLERGWDVHPYTMRCWDDAEAKHEESCWDREVRAARNTATHLGLRKPVEIDLVADYWTRVFEPFLEGVRNGWTGNVDLLCNREIKFGEFANRLGGMIGTGHYARIESGGLKSGLDEIKDQSYFLANVPREVFERVIFPVGWLKKEEVREIGKFAELPALREKSSKGMCFVGKRPMGEFLGRYVDGREGRFVDVERRSVGRMKWSGFGYTIGQRARVGGLDEAVYVVGRDKDDVIVAKEGDKRLWSSGVFCERIEWMNGEVCGRVVMKTCSTAKRMGGMVSKVDSGWIIVFDHVVKRVTQGQVVVLYDDDDVVLGAAWPVEHVDAANELSRFVDVGWRDVAMSKN